jgi:hypothetical protein
MWTLEMHLHMLLHNEAVQVSLELSNEAECDRRKLTGRGMDGP